MRDHVRAFVEVAAAAFELGGPVYEFGSYQVPEQAGLGDLRPFFPGRQYVGCDMREGPGVDRVEDLARLNLPDGIARTILCVDTLEHVFEVRRAVDEMIRALAPGGILLVSVPMDFRVHSYPDDYWRLTPSCLRRLFEPLGAALIGWQGVENFPHTVFGIGCKEPVSSVFARGANRFIEGYQAALAQAARRVTWQRQIKRRLFGWAWGKGQRQRERHQHRVGFVLDLPGDCLTANDLVPDSSASAGTGSRLDL
ncbi:MAG: class I SAM-dependent methyltransferase [Pirellulales bacterium]